MIEHHLRVKDLGGASGFLPNTPFILLILNQDEVYTEAVKAIPMGRHAEPDEMAGTVLYLVSNASSYANGECIVVDVGTSAL